LTLKPKLIMRHDAIGDMTSMSNLHTMVATRGGKQPFTVEGAMKSARGFHHAAGELEALQRRMIRKQSVLPRWVPLSCLVIVNKTSIGRRLFWLVSNGLHIGRHLLFGANLQNPHEVMGRIAGAIVLEALALEIVLKARLLRAEIQVPRTHDHSALYGLLPDTEKQEAEQRYQSAGWPPLRATTLAEALSASANVFMEWRYMHEHVSVQASTGEIQRAYAALAGGMPE
jgi:hypothetical protein